MNTLVSFSSLESASPVAAPSIAVRDRGSNITDPALLALESYWAAVKLWTSTNRRLKRLQKRLSEDLMREPRVRVSWLLRGRDDAGAEVKEPIYAHSEFEIERVAERDCKLLISIHAPTVATFFDPGTESKTRRRRNNSESAKKRRAVIRANSKIWKKAKLAEFQTDKNDLYSRQAAAGWRQVKEQERDAWARVVNTRYKAQGVTPTTIEGAIALLAWIHTAHVSEAHCADGEHSPYALGKSYAAGIARRTAAFLKEQRSSGVKRA